MKILVPLDGSKLGETALTYVEELISQLSPRSKIEMILLQVIPSELSYRVGGEEAYISREHVEKLKEEWREEAIKYLNKTGEGLRSKGALVTAKVVTGPAAEEIVKAADEIKADLIAMSTHGRSGLSRWAFGSVTDKVLRMEEGKIPILMARAKTGT